MTEAAASRPRRVWASLGTQNAVRGVIALVLVYALIIGALVFGYARVSTCLAKYADKSSTSTTARSNAAAEDRKADQVERDINEAERVRLAANDAALDKVLIATSGTDQAKKIAAFKELLAVRAETARQRKVNDVRREDLTALRARTEQARLSNPIPPPPSQSC
jgi:hypothetical protein